MTIRNNDLLLEHLRKQGLDQCEMDLVMAKLHDHDRRTVHQSVFDSIENGTFNLQAIVAEVKAESRQSSGKKADIARDASR